MQLTADMILTDFGAKLPLDQRRREALALYARAKHQRTQTRWGAQAWVEQEWGLKDYEAKDLLKGNASEAVWERIVKHPNGGWQVVIPVMGAVIGLSLEAHIEKQAEEARLARAQWEARERYIAALSSGVRGRRAGPEPRSYAMWGVGADVDDLGLEGPGDAVGRQAATARRKRT